MNRRIHVPPTSGSSCSTTRQTAANSIRLAALALALSTATSATAIEFANIDVEQHDTANNTTSVTVTKAQGTPDFLVRSGSNRGDYNVQIGATHTDDAAGGVLITSVSQNGVDHGQGQGFQIGTSSIARSGGGYFIPLHQAPSGAEFNIDVAAAYFPYDTWTAGNAWNDSNGGALVNFEGSPGLALGTHVIDHGAGHTQLYLPGIDSNSSGVLLVNGGKNEDNFAMAHSNADGSFSIISHDNGANANSYEQDPVAFAFVPYETPGVVAGKFTHSGTGKGVWNQSGDFNLERVGTGEIRLSIPGEGPTTGTLIVSPEGGVNLNVDNIVTYQPSGSDWIIQTRDITGMGLQDLSDGEPVASFVFLPFDAPPAAPGAIRTVMDVDRQVTAWNAAVAENNSGNGPNDIDVTIDGSTGRVTSIFGNRGDNAFAVDGQAIHPHRGVVLATPSETDRDNSATGGVSGNAVAAPWASATAGWVVATHGADGGNPGEMNANFAATLFPYAQGWAAGAAVRTDGGQAEILVNQPGGNSLTDGLMFVNAFGNDDNFATVEPKADGSGWDVQVRDNSGGLETDNGGNRFNYVFIPANAENVVGAYVDPNGNAIGGAGGFTLAKQGTGRYRLSVDDGSPSQGMLLLNANHSGWSSDNLLTYEADGNDFLIQGFDAGSGPASPQDTGFNFAYISYDNPPALPEDALRPFTPQVYGANFQVIENDPGNDATSVTTSTVAGDPLFTISGGNRGDFPMAYDDVGINWAEGVMLAQVRQNFRDNSATGGLSGHGIAQANNTYNDYQVSLHPAHGANPGSNEINTDFAAAFFPFGAGFEVGRDAITGGQKTLKLPGAGDTRSSGVMLGNANGNDDNFVSIQTLGDGSGWTFRLLDNSGGTETGNDPFSYAFLPYGTENLVAGHVLEAGYLQSKTGNFALVREGAGLYRLNIPGHTPDTGMLLLNATHEGWSGDNLLTYQADGDDFLIHGLDAGPGAAGLQDTNFNFAFLPFDTPIANPKLREFNPTAISAANIRVIQNDTGNSATSVSVYTEGGSDNFTVHNANKGDFHPSIDGNPVSLADGILMATARNNGRDNGDGAGALYGVVSVEHNGLNPNMWIPVDRVGSNGETNMDLAAGFFPFEGGYIGGHFNSSGASLKDSLPAGSSLTRTATGRYQLSFPDVDSRSDGLLFAINGSNSDNSFTAGVMDDGSGWDIGSYDNQADFGSFQNEDFSLLYLPMTTTASIAALGRVDADGTVLAGDGFFDVSKTDVGEYLLEVGRGFTPEDGMLLLTASEMLSGTPADNVLSYEPFGDDFLIQSRDLPGALLDDVAFSFAFVRFQIPEPGSAMLLVLALGGFLALGNRRRGRRRA